MTRRPAPRRVDCDWHAYPHRDRWGYETLFYIVKAPRPACRSTAGEVRSWDHKPVLAMEVTP